MMSLLPRSKEKTKGIWKPRANQKSQKHKGWWSSLKFKKHWVKVIYRINNNDYSTLPRNLICNNYSLDINFICLSINLVSKLEDCLQRYQISINKIISAQYVKSYFNNKDDLFKNTKKITEGCNPNEVEFYVKTSKNKGFFEKFFNFFS